MRTCANEHPKPSERCFGCSLRIPCRVRPLPVCEFAGKETWLFPLISALISFPADAITAHRAVRSSFRSNHSDTVPLGVTDNCGAGRAEICWHSGDIFRLSLLTGRACD
jgi:hypothetical protein